MSKILVTGGAGFIGSHLVDRLIEDGHEVRIYDNLDSQVHGNSSQPPRYINKEAEFIKADIRDKDALKKAINGVEVISHQAAAVGVGQSMYEVRRYMEINTLGTANLLDIIVNEKNSVEKIIVASSMSIYGEGKYNCPDCGVVFPKLRPIEQLRARQWEMRCPDCDINVTPLPTDEEKPLFPTSVYATSKRDQEELFINLGRAYDIPAVALRYFNVYGPRQALSNPYTGVAAIFSSRIINGRNPIVYEDGYQGRDFIHVSDIAEANILALEKEEANYEVFNVGTGRMVNLLQILNLLITKLGDGTKLRPEIVNKFREGDIRFCYADPRKIEQVLGFRAKIKFEDGFSDLISWVKDQICEDKSKMAMLELEKRGLTK